MRSLSHITSAHFGFWNVLGWLPTDRLFHPVFHVLYLNKKIALAPNNIHPMFHVSQLKKANAPTLPITIYPSILDAGLH